MIRSADGDTVLFDIVPGFMRKDIKLISFMSSRMTSATMKMVSHEKKKKERSRWYPAETMADADYADDLALLRNTPA